MRNKIAPAVLASAVLLLAGCSSQEPDGCNQATTTLDSVATRIEAGTDTVMSTVEDGGAALHSQYNELTALGRSLPGGNLKYEVDVATVYVAQLRVVLAEGETGSRQIREFMRTTDVVHKLCSA